MSNNYALVENGVVVNTVVWDGAPYVPAVDGIPAVLDAEGNEVTPAVPAVPASGWAPPEGMQAVELPDGSAVSIGYLYDGSTFTAPASQTPAMTPAQILAFNTGRRDNFLATATAAIAPLQDAVDLGDATTAETALLKAWKTYRVAVNRVDLTLASPTWPTAPA